MQGKHRNLSTKEAFPPLSLLLLVLLLPEMLALLLDSSSTSLPSNESRVNVVTAPKQSNSLRAYFFLPIPMCLSDNSSSPHFDLVRASPMTITFLPSLFP